MKRPDMTVAAIVSDGPKSYPDSTYVKATPCPVCGGTIDRGEWIAKIGTYATGEQWAHRDCAQNAVNTTTVRNAWALIGADAARRPRAYKATDLRTILEHLVQLVYLDEYDEDIVG